MIDILTAVCIVTSIGLIPDEKQHHNFLANAEWRASPDERVSARSVGGEFQTMPTYICQTCKQEFLPKRVSPTYRPKFCSQVCRGKAVSANPAERFWKHVGTAEANECWEWKRSSGRGGYGTFVTGNKKIAAHRYAFFLTHGYFPVKPNEVCHTCDNPPCCNPKHLFDGTRSDNVQDCIRKGRFTMACGEDAGKAKLTEDHVRFIRSVYSAHARGFFSGPSLAKHFEVGASAIYAIVRHKSWKHL